MANIIDLDGVQQPKTLSDATKDALTWIGLLFIGYLLLRKYFKF